MTRHPRLLPLVAGTVLAVGLAGAPSPAPAGAVNPDWSVTVDEQPVATGPAVVVTGRAGWALGTVTAVRVRLVPRVELPAACGPFPVERSVAPSGGRYHVEVAPPCNGPYRAEVVASGRLHLLGTPGTSGRPAQRDLGLAEAGPAPGAPGVTHDGGQARVTWMPSSDPDVVGWTLVHDGGATRQFPAATTQLVAPVGAGDHGFHLVARRWGADGPAGPVVGSPPSDSAALHVPQAVNDPPTVPGSEPDTVAPPGDNGDRSGGPGTPPSGRRSSLPAPGGRSASPPAGPPRRAPSGPSRPGYRPELPYGAPGRTSPGGATDAGAGEQSAVGTSPSARVVRTSERVSPGLVAPFALALLLFTAAVHLASYLRRAARGPAAGGG